MPRIKFDMPDESGALVPHQVDIPLSERNGLLRLTNAEAKHVARVADLSVRELFEAAVRDLQPEAVTVLIQVGLKRQGIVRKFEDVEFDWGSLEFDAVPDAEDWLEDAPDAATAGDDELDPTTAPNGGEIEAG